MSVLEGGKVFLFLKNIIVLRIVGVVVIRNLLVLFFGLHLASIAFLPEGKVKVAAIVANPITLSSFRRCFILHFVSLVILFERSVKLVHFMFLLFGLKKGIII